MCKYGLQILEGLSVLHKQDISHRDLKHDNILVKNGVCKIVDFGFGTDQAFFKSKVGAIGFRAPELFGDKEDSASSAVDVWAFGVMMHFAAFKKYPFCDDKFSYERFKNNVRYDAY